MAKKNTSQMIGGWAFIVGIVLAVVISLFGTAMNQTLLVTLVILGLIVGLLNITEEETTPFMMSGAVLVIVSALGHSVVSIVPVVGNMLEALLILFVPATIIVAAKNVFSLAKH